jgi:hypothetical protein
MQKTKKTLLLFLIGLLALFVCFLMLWFMQVLMLLIMFGGFQSKTYIHKAMNHGQYIILVVSRVNYVSMSPHGYIYTEVWLDNKKIKSYRMTYTDEVAEYNYRIKDVTLLPDSGEVRVEFDGPYGISPDGKSRTDVGLYKIVDD